MMIVTGADEISTANALPNPHQEGRGAVSAGRTVRTYVFIGQLVGEPDPLRLVFHRLAIDNGRLELLGDGPVDGVALGSRTRSRQSRGVLATSFHSSSQRRLTKSSTVHLVERSTTGAE